MRLYRLNNSIDAKSQLEDLGVDSGAKKLLEEKMQYHLIKIEQMHVAAANILKQDALSIGAELAVPKGVITCEHKYVDAVLMGTTKHLKLLSKKELAQPFGLKTLAHQLKAFTDERDDDLQIMGIINANDDSFFSGSRFKDRDAVAKIEKMIQEGAHIIDIGGVSSRPGSDPVSADEELKRVKPIIDAVKTHRLYEKARFSLDSYAPKVLDYALSSGFHIVNDITGLADDDVCKVAAGYDAQVIIMHMQGTPQTMQADPSYESIIPEVTDFFQERIEKAQSFGIKDIVLDIGIGFGKTLEHNLMLLKHLRHFKSLGFPLLVGASRKSMIDHILPTPIEERLPATLAIHMEAFNNGASIIRCHDVREHLQALSINLALKKV